jgi:hypothetical protein
MRTFVVRLADGSGQSQPEPSGHLSVPGAIAETGQLRGIADEIATGRRLTFSSGAELLDLLAAPAPATPSSSHDQEDTDESTD